MQIRNYRENDWKELHALYNRILYADKVTEEFFLEHLIFTPNFDPEGVFIARTRHVQALRLTAEHLAQAADHAAQADAALDLFAEELRLAHQALQQITGKFSADDLLGEIFGRFCIGK